LLGALDDGALKLGHLRRDEDRDGERGDGDSGMRIRWTRDGEQAGMAGPGMVRFSVLV
jgi:hypothetical protein